MDTYAVPQHVIAVRVERPAILSGAWSDRVHTASSSRWRDLYLRPGGLLRGLMRLVTQGRGEQPPGLPLPFPFD
jgi:hypothetical protein